MDKRGERVMNLGEKLYDLRKKHNFSQEEIAEKLNVTRQTVSKWETGESKPDIDKIIPICELFQITTEELLTGKEIKKEEITLEEKTDLKENLDTKERTKKRAALIAASIFLYFISVVFIIMSEELNIGSVFGVSGFLLICGIATSLLVYQGIVYSKKEEEKTEEDSPRQKQLKMVTELVAFIFLIIYLFVSFTTYAWHITWIIWLIYAAGEKIITLAFSLRGEEDE